MKLGLIAMSGVRAHNEELTRLGLTLPGFVERNKKIATLPSLGLLTLAGLTPSNIEVVYIEVEDINEQEGLPGEYDAVAISSFSAQIKEAYELADRYRLAGTTVLLGGLHVTGCPDEAQQHADCVVIGEGEPVWPHVMHDLLHGQLKSRYDARGNTFDLAQAPMPCFDLLDHDRYNRITVQTARGCPFSCEFCAASIRLSPKYRVKPVSKVIAEIQQIKTSWSKPFIEFADDNSFVNKRHSKALLRELAKEDIRWFTESDISIAQDDELLGLMRDSGCAQVLIGFESPSAISLHGIETKTDWKARQYNKYMQAVERIQSHGISVNGCFILGLDGTGNDSFQAVRDFVTESGLHEVQVTVQTAFPNTPLYQRLKNAGRIINEGAWELCTLFDVNFVPDRMSVKELEDNFRWLVSELYSDKETQRRKSHFFQQLRNARRQKNNLLVGHA
ncbi:MAG: B12-binding domain-containing radical SAM protein [Gammaproteobacteria bacterium]|nr:B12-binding domain-containing radical SAM protein [Gammaproteobacteria bacterium]